MLSFALSICATTFAQGDGYVYFSSTGDTLITRNSCYGKKKDTLSSYFVVLKNVNSNLEVISVFVVEEPNKNSIPCADFKLVSKDTLAKYGLNVLGKQGTYPNKKLHIRSKVVKLENAGSNEQGYIYKRLIRHKFKIGWKTFHVEYLHDLAATKNAEIHPPRIKSIFGNREINKYYMIIITVDENINPETQRKHTVNCHKKIISGKVGKHIF